MSSQYDSTIPDGEDTPGPLSPNDDHDAEFISDINGYLKDYIDAMESVKIRLGLQIVMSISSRGNTYLQASGLGKALMTENPIRCAQVISRAVNLIYILSALIYPFMPATSDSILAQLNAPARVVPEVLSNDILADHQIGKPEHLFKKIEESMAETWRLRFGGDEAAKAAPAVEDSSKAKRKGKKEATSSKADAGPKSPEVLALEAKVAEQGSAVRALKGQTPKTVELDAQIKIAVDELKRLKGELEILQTK